MFTLELMNQIIACLRCLA